MANRCGRGPRVWRSSSRGVSTTALEEKAAEVEAAIEYEIRVRGGDADPIARSLAERLDRIRRQKEEADADMLSLLEELVSEYASEKEAHEALGDPIALRASCHWQPHCAPCRATTVS